MVELLEGLFPYRLGEEASDAGERKGENLVGKEKTKLESDCAVPKKSAAEISSEDRRKGMHLGRRWHRCRRRGTEECAALPAEWNRVSYNSALTGAPTFASAALPNSPWRKL